MDLTPNLPDVVAEVRDLFERYEQALISPMLSSYNFTQPFCI